MFEERGGLVVLIGAVIAVVLQMVLAPNIALFGAVPNFMLAFTLVVAILRSQQSGVLLPFVMGMAFDLLGGGPVGAMAFLLVLASFVVSSAFSVLNNDTLFMPLVLLVIATLAVEMLYGVFLMWFGMDVSAVQAFAYRSLPCALYDAALGLLMYPLAMRVMSGQPQQPGMSSMR